DQVECVDLPVAQAFQLWQQVELLPRFMRGVRRVIPVSSELSMWQTTLGGRSHTVDVLLDLCRTNDELVWRSVGPAGFRLAVSFRAVDEGSTEVRLRVDVAADGPSCATDLLHFKDYVEANSWRRAA